MQATVECVHDWKPIADKFGWWSCYKCSMIKNEWKPLQAEPHKHNVPVERPQGLFDKINDIVADVMVNGGGNSLKVSERIVNEINKHNLERDKPYTRHCACGVSFKTSYFTDFMCPNCSKPSQDAPLHLDGLAMEVKPSDKITISRSVADQWLITMHDRMQTQDMDKHDQEMVFELRKALEQ